MDNVEEERTAMCFFNNKCESIEISLFKLFMNEEVLKL